MYLKIIEIKEQVNFLHFINNFNKLYLDKFLK